MWKVMDLKEKQGVEEWVEIIISHLKQQISKIKYMKHKYFNVFFHIGLHVCIYIVFVRFQTALSSRGPA